MTLRTHSLRDLSSTGNAPVMHRICTAIANRRRDQANTLPAPEGWQPPKQGRIRRAIEWVATQVTGIKEPQLGEAYRETPTHLDPP